MMVTWENYEEYIILHADGELTDSEEQELQAFIKQHPKLQAEMDAFETVRFTPDTAKVFAEKGQLLKPVPSKKVIPLKWWTYSAAAACVLLFLLVKPGSQQQKTTASYVNTAPQINRQSAPSPVADTLRPVATQVKKQIAITARPTHHNTVKKEITVVERKAGVSRMPVRTITAIQVATNSYTIALPEGLTVIEPDFPIEQMKKDTVADKDILAWLPIDEEKKEGLSEIKADINDKIMQVRAMKRELKDTRFILKFGNKEIAFNL